MATCNKKCPVGYTLDTSTCMCKPPKTPRRTMSKATQSRLGAPSLKKGGTMKIKKKK